MNDLIVGARQGAAPFPISILDFAMAGKGLTASEALDASIDLAPARMAAGVFGLSGAPGRPERNGGAGYLSPSFPALGGARQALCDRLIRRHCG